MRRNSSLPQELAEFEQPRPDESRHGARREQGRAIVDAKGAETSGADPASSSTAAPAAASTPTPAATTTAATTVAAEAAPTERGHNLRSMRRAVWIVTGLAITTALYAAAALVLPILIAILLALLLAPLVRRLTNLHVPQHIGAALVVVLAIALIVGLAMALAAPVDRWINAGPQELRRLEQKVTLLLRPVLAVKQATERVTAITDGNGAPNSANAAKKTREVAVERTSLATVLDITVTTMITVMATTVLVFFLLASGDLFLRKTVRLLPRLRDKIRAVDIAREVQIEIGRYFGAITLVATGIGVSTAIAMWLLDMPTPVLWGVIAGVLNFVPYLGPLTSIVLLAGVGLITFDTPLHILAPPLAYMGLNLIEDQLVMPIVVGRRLVMNPVVIFVWVLACTWMWGLAGIVIAVPLLVAVRICAERLPALAPLAELMGRE